MAYHEAQELAQVSTKRALGKIESNIMKPHFVKKHVPSLFGG